MTPRQTELVQETWRQMLPIAEAAAALFYERLFEVDPSTRPLFAHADLREQRRKLMGVLAIAVRGLSELDALVPVVRDLGARHAGYGVQTGHYASVGAALLWTLRKGLGEAWTSEVAAAWAAAYGLLADVMCEGAGAALGSDTLIPEFTVHVRSA